MPPRDISLGNDTLSIPCYLAKGSDDPGFLLWARAHPDWLVAGTWTEGSPGEGDAPTQGAAGTDVHNRPPEAAPPAGAVRATVGRGKPPPPPLDPATISLDDFRKVKGI